MTDSEVKKIDPELIRKLKNERLFRKSDIVSGSIDEKERTVDLTFSSELPVERYFGMEILDHSGSAADLSRLNAGGAVLVDHQGDQVGVVKQAFIDPTARKGMAKLKFSKSSRGQEVFQDICDGIRRNISFAYTIDPESIINCSDNTYRMMKWTPHEISVVGIPADATVGIGRSLDQKKEVEPEAIIEVKEQPATKEVKTMDEEKRVNEILAITEKYPQLMAEARVAIKNKTALEEFQKTAMEKLYQARAVEIKTNTNVEEIGLSKKEVKNFSIVKAIQAMASGNPEKAAFEFEASRACAKKTGKDPQGIYIPQEVVHSRIMNVGTPAAGGDLVATDLLASSMIELLRNRTIMINAGAQTLTGLVGDIAIPKQTGGATAYWVAEGVAPATSDQAIGQIALKPKTVGAYTDFTRKLMLQSSIDIEQFVRSDLATVLAIELDRAILNGSGIGAEPSGLMGKIAGDYIPSSGNNGGAPTWENIVKLESVIDSANALTGSLSYITNPKVRGTLKTTVKVKNYPVFLMDDNGNINGYRSLVSNQVPSNLTKGEGSNLSALIFGNFSDVIIGMWGYMDVKVDPYSLSTSGSIRVIVLQDIDTNVRHLESFSALKDLVTI